MTIYRAFGSPYGSPWYGGGSQAVGAGKSFDVTLCGRNYMLDLNNPANEPFRIQTIPLLRQQADPSRTIGEQSINPEDFWRRSADTWHLGAGQTFLDHEEASVEGRFRSSKGIDPWTRGQISLHLDTDQKLSSANTNLQMVTAGDYLYVLDGNALKYTQDITTDSPTFTTVTADGTTTALSSPTSITTDGNTIWVCDGTRVNYTTRGTATFGKYHTADHVAELIRFVKDRLLTANNAVVYTHSGTAGAATAATLTTHPNSDWTWTDICDGPTQIYLSGYSGDKSTLFKTALVTISTALTVPIVCASTPDGETIQSLQTYLNNFLLLGTDKGVRFALINESGDIQIQNLIPTTTTVKCFEPQDRFVWFGWTNYDSTSTGLGRLDLSALNDGTPAYASDLMVTGSGAILSVVTMDNIRCFSISGLGVYASHHSSNLVASGTLDSGLFGYNLPDTKTAVKIDVRHRNSDGEYTIALSADEGSFTQLGAAQSAASGGGTTITCNNTQAEQFETRLTLTRDATTATLGPIFHRWTLRADPSVERRNRIIAPLRLHHLVKNRVGTDVRYDVAFEREELAALARSRTPCSFQDGEQSYTVVVEDLYWLYHQANKQGQWDGTLITSMKTI